MGRRARRIVATWGGLLLSLATAAAIQAPGRALAEPWFHQVTLAKGGAQMGEPMSLAVLPDRSVLHTSRDGTLRRTDAAGDTTVAGRLNVYHHDEEGLQGVGVDPDFEVNRYVYLYYAPPLSTPKGNAPTQGKAADFARWRGVNRLSRFVLAHDGRLDFGSETRILDVPTDRGICCHVGGDIDFDGDGNLYLSTGDDTNTFQSGGYTPIDERADRNPAFDAQRTSGNTNDLRGKLLRIHVNSDGSYDIPPGNLFRPGTPGTRPEIYAMGFRNPFRFNVDRATGVVYLGDYGPDAAVANPARGPGGQVEFNRIAQAGNYGWPYCTGDNDAYVDFTFPTGPSGQRFDCDGGPINSSPRNTGLKELPPAIPAWLPYDGGSVPEFGNGSESPMGGPVYHYDPDLHSGVSFPREYDGNLFIGEYGRRWIKRIGFNDDGTISIRPFPWSGTQVIDMAFGPDGAMYVLDYGTGYANGNANAALYRIEYVNGGRAPTAVVSATPDAGAAPLTAHFSAAGSSDPDGDKLSYDWDFDGDGVGDATGAKPTHTYGADGTYKVRLTVRDPGGKVSTAATTVTVGNTPPKLTLATPADGQVIGFGDTVPFKVTVTDREDKEIDCSLVTVAYSLGHDDHAHELSATNGCTGTIQTSSDGDHAQATDLFGVWTATYTDSHGMTGVVQHVTQQPTRQAEHYSAASGVQIVQHGGAHGGATVGFIHNGDHVKFTHYNMARVASFRARVSSAGAGGRLELRLDSPKGKLIGAARVPVTGGWEKFEVVSGKITAPAGSRSLYLVFKGGKGVLFDVDDFTFVRGR